MTTTVTHSPLLTPYRSPALSLPNRIAMAPMTRNRADDATGIPNPLTRTYYAQRASAGLIITEGIWPTLAGKGEPGVPGLANADHVEGWREVTTAVHAAGGRIFAQLWHVGRLSHPVTLGTLPMAPSAVRPPGTIHTVDGKLDYVTPREMTLGDIEETIAAFAAAASNAIEAGFDGVEVHGANGYLIQQFLGDNTNLRTDAYGRRDRFVLDVVDAVIAAVGADRVALRLSPGNPENDVLENDPASVYPALVSALDERGLAYLHLSEKGTYPAISELRKRWSGTLIGNYDPVEPSSPELGEKLLLSGDADVVAFGRLFIANPDLPMRIAAGAPLAALDRQLFHRGGAQGYTDQPALGVC